MKKSVFSVFSVSVLLAVAACVDHRPVRNGLTDETIYLKKADLTSPNPKVAPANDDGWLFKVTIVKASSPNIAGDYAFPGLESDSEYVKVRFAENAMQILDGRRLQSDDPNDPNDDLTTATERVIFELGGSNVDIKLHESLDGERTNLLEENREEPWQKRQMFKVELERTTLDPITNIAWFYGDFLHDCARPVSSNYVPGSFEWSSEDQSLTFVLEVNYQLNLLSNLGACYDLVSLATGAGGATIQYRFSFYRPGPSTYVPEVIAEKAEVNKKYGAFQDLNIFEDEETGLLSAKSLLRRFDPNRADPVVFYFHEGFPPRFKPMFEDIERETNKILENAGAKLRFDFREWNDGGIERHLGDLRYSFVTWNQDIEGTRGLLGYGPSSSDPRTGELVSANVNLYNIGLDWYRFLIQDYLEEFGGTHKPDPSKKWEEITCTAGETVAPMDQKSRLKSTLFEEMRRTLDLPPSTEDSIATDDFLPDPIRGRDAFLEEYHRTLPEVRYVEPLWNAYVYHPRDRLPLEGLAERLTVEREFQSMMSKIMLNENPFEGAALSSRAGLDAQQEFLGDFRDWKKNHQRLQMEQEIALGHKNIYVFNPTDAISAVAASARRCTPSGRWESDEEYQERIIEAVVFRIAIHEFGHTVSLRHNFYGSVDAKHMAPGETTASVMDYVAPWEELGSPRTWGAYDAAALTWIYGTPAKRAEVMAQDHLYCTDEHRFRSPLCQAYDLGITPSQIVLNAIERYDWLYSIRNRRSFRTFWDTSGYVGSVYNAMFPLLRMWYLGIFDWGGGGVQDILKRLDQVGGGHVRTDQEYDEISLDFYNDIQQAIGLIIAFYDAVINQPASFRNYQTEFDPFYGDILRIGIIIDKLFTTFAFMDLQEVYDYNPNVNTYVAMYDAPFGSRNEALSQRVLDNMLGASYDTFPWFKYYALGIFASVTNTNLVDKIELKDRIAIKRYENREEIELELGAGVLDAALAIGNPAQTFVHNGEEYVYTFLPDRSWHLVSGRSRSPVSFQFMKDYNESLRTGSETEDNFGLKILLAYYEYYNNFQGF